MSLRASAELGLSETGEQEEKMNKNRDSNIQRALEMSGKLASLAEEGEAESEDDGCRVLFGVVRDCAYKIRMRAEDERETHRALDEYRSAGGRSMKKAVVGLMAATLVCSLAWAEDGTWNSDFAKAKSVAADKKLPILALFTGSDWCP